MLKLIKLIFIVFGIAFVAYLVLVVGLGWLVAHPNIIGEWFGKIVHGFNSIK